MTKTQWAERLKKWRQDNIEHYAKTILADPEKVPLYKTIPLPGVELIMGDRRQGKTGLAHEIANQVHNKRGYPAVIHIPHIPQPLIQKIQKKLPSWMKIVRSRSEWPKDSVVIYDEAAQSAHARRAQSGDAVELDDLISVSGQRNQTILFISHHSRKLDVNIITEVNRIIWKKPTYAHQLFERDEVADFSMRAYQYFEKVRDGKPWNERTLAKAKKLCLVLDMQNFGLYQCTNGLPPWWDEELSCLFREIERVGKGASWQ